MWGLAGPESALFRRSVKLRSGLGNLPGTSDFMSSRENFISR